MAVFEKSDLEQYHRVPELAKYVHFDCFDYDISLVSQDTVGISDSMILHDEMRGLSPRGVCVKAERLEDLKSCWQP